MRRRLKAAWWVLRGRSVAYRIEFGQSDIRGLRGAPALIYGCRFDRRRYPTQPTDVEP